MLAQSLRRFSLAALATILALTGVEAQVLSRLEGHVQDSSGAVVQGAKVTARNIDTGVVYRTASNDSGGYVFNSLPPAAYELRCEAAGFKATVRSGLVMETGLTKTIDIPLDLGAISEVVQVKSAAPLLDTGTATGQFVESATVMNMALDSRRLGSLARLAGAVAFTSEAGNGSTPDFSMAGGRSENQMWMTDGATTSAIALGSPATSTNPPAESVQEMKMETNNYAAEFGRAGGGLVLITTKSGTNTFHGALYEFLRNDKLNARTFFSPGKAPLRYNTFGFSVGGPVIKNKTFFFVNFEADRRHTGNTISSTVPNPAELNGDFSLRKDVAIKDPATTNPFPGNIIPTNRMDPIGLAYAKFYPAPLQPTDPTRAPTINFVKNVSDTLNRGFLTARGDHTISDKDRVFGRVIRDTRTGRSAALFPDPIVDPRSEGSHNNGFSVLGVWIHSFSPTLFHETRYLYASRASDGTFTGAGSGLNGKLGLKGVDPTFSATISITGITGVGSSNQKDTGTQRTNQLIDSLTWIKGNHQIKTGMEYRNSLLGATSGQLAGGSFSFSDRATGSGLATMLLGWTSSAQLIANDLISARSDYWGVYVQDAWKLSPRLTLSMGMRWEIDAPRWDSNNRQSGFNPAAINPISNTLGIVTFAGKDGVSKYAHDFDKNNFAPKFAIAWRPSDTLVIRSGYGIYYYGEYADNVTRLANAGFGVNGSFTSPDGGFTPAFLFKNGLPDVAREALTAGYGAVPVGSSPRFAPDFFQQDHASAYSQQWNFTIQKELPKNLLAEIAYLGNVAHKLGGQNVNINQIPLVNGRGPAAQNQRLRPFPQFNAVNSDWPSWGNSSYHGMVAKLEKRYSSGLNVLMNYTWSKFLDDVKATAEIGAQTGSGYTHIERRRLDKSYSGSHIPHNFIASTVYDVPLGRGRRFRAPNAVMEEMFGGWGLGAMITLRSGPPYGVVQQTNTTNTFSDSVRPNLLRDPEISGSRSRQDMINRYFDTSAFAAPAVGEFGNAAREVGLGPGLIQVDLSVHKTFSLTERFRLVFRSEFINLPNHPNFNNPNVQQGNPNFGRITATRYTGRVVEFGLRLEW